MAWSKLPCSETRYATNEEFVADTRNSAANLAAIGTMTIQKPSQQVCSGLWNAVRKHRRGGVFTRDPTQELGRSKPILSEFTLQRSCDIGHDADSIGYGKSERTLLARGYARILGRSPVTKFR